MIFPVLSEKRYTPGASGSTFSAAAIASGTLGAGSRSGAITRPSATAKCISAIQDAQNLVERLAEFDHRLARGDISKAIPWAQGGTNGNNTLAQGGTVGVAKLRGPGAVRQESGAGTLINELIKDALKELGRAETSLIK